MYLGQPMSLSLFIVHLFNHLFLRTYVYTYTSTKGLRAGIMLLQFNL